MEDTNREKITPSENKFMENCIPASEQMASATNIEEDTLQTATDCTPQTEQQTDTENKPAPPLAKRIAWYDIVVFILTFFASQIAGAFITIKLGITPADTSLFESADFEIVENAEHAQARFVAISLFSAMVLCFGMLRIYRLIRNWKIKLSKKAPGWASPFRLLCGYFLLWCISIAAEPITSLLPTDQSHMGSGGWLLISAVLIAPIFEETLFRGYIAGGLQYAYGSVVAWILSSIIFGVAHGQAAVMVSATMSGLVLGFYFLRYRSVVLSMILHAMNNITVCFLHTFDAEELTLRELIGNNDIYWSIQILCSIISLAAIVRMFFIIKGLKNEKYIS